MDVKTLMAGIRPLLPHETGAREKALAAVYGLALSQSSLTLENFITSLPKELLGLHFGTTGFENLIVRALAVIHQKFPIRDVIKVAVLNQLVMELTYQGRHIHAWRLPEAAVFIGSSVNEVACAMMNGACILGVRLNEGFAADALFADIVVTAGKASIPIGAATYRAISDLRMILEMENRDLGLLVLDDLDGLPTFRDAMDQAAHRCRPETFYVFCDEAHRIAKFAAEVARHHAEAQISVRYYRLADHAAESHGLMILTGMTGGLSPLLDTTTRQTMTFIAANDPQTPVKTDGRIGMTPFGSEFCGGDPSHDQYERVLVKPPIVLRSSAPLPIYSRDKMERPVLVPHRVGLIKKGGVVYSRDPEHATYFYVSSQGELVSDIIETESFYRSPMYRDAIKEQEQLISSTIDFRHIRKIKGAAIPLCFAPNAHEYHSHFLLQCFPRVLIARELCKDATFLVPHDLKRYQMEMLHLVGVPEERIFPIAPGTVIFSDELYVPELWPAIFNRYGSRIYDELIEKVVPRASKPHRRIMISRAARQTWRNMVNFNAVSQVLEDEFGFEVVTPDKLTLRDEIELFRESRIIAGAEGAGLYNCCFADRDSAVLNFADQDYVMYIVGSMAQIRGFDVGYVFGESFIADTDLARRFGHSDFVVNPAHVRSGIREMVDRLAAR